MANRESGARRPASDGCPAQSCGRLVIEPDLLFIFDLVDDPDAGWDLVGKAWRPLGLVGPVANRLGELQQIMTRYPNIVPAQEFHGIRIGH